MSVGCYCGCLTVKFPFGNRIKVDLLINMFKLLFKVVKEVRKEMFYLTTHSTHFIYGYMASDIMVKDHSDSERGNPLPPHGLLLSINSKGYFICTIP